MTDKTEDLKSPGGTYTATLTFAIGDKTGTEYNTSMSAAGGSFGVNVWRVRPGKPAELIITKPGCHGALFVVHRKLWFYWNTADKPLGKQWFCVVFLPKSAYRAAAVACACPVRLCSRAANCCGG
jgi:hypothetical protein